MVAVKETKKTSNTQRRQKKGKKLLSSLLKLKTPALSSPAVAPAVALDCEMVGSHETSLLARVSICDENGEKLLDEFVRPKGFVTDYRQHITGLTPQILRERGISFEAAHILVRNMIKGKILVGHAVHNDLQVLALTHPLHLIRDTGTYKRLRPPGLKSHKTPSLRHLAEVWLKRSIQTGTHDSLEDCRAVMSLYKMFQNEWEQQFLAFREKEELCDGIVEAEDVGLPASVQT